MKIIQVLLGVVMLALKLDAVDGKWSEWSEYGVCEAERTRSCDGPAEQCEGADRETVKCSKGPCPVHGGWTEWYEYHPCDVPCGQGKQTRYRGCHNPEPAHGGRLCEGQTTGANKETRPCFVRNCRSGCQGLETRGTDYNGKYSRTRHNFPCKAWASPSVRKYGQTADNMPEKTLEEAKNYCRNPNKHVLGVWCYSTNPNKVWEICRVPVCGDCQNANDLGTTYSGGWGKTKSGKTCQAWASQTPHRHGWTAVHMPDSSLIHAKNHCRNPNNHRGGVWCLTTDPNMRWDECDIPECRDPHYAPKCFMYCYADNASCQTAGIDNELCEMACRRHWTWGRNLCPADPVCCGMESLDMYG